jgi:hypothetical protein
MRLLWRVFAAAVPAVIAGFIAGCASSGASGNTPAPGDGIAEYKQITAESLTEVQAALTSLDKVSAQTNNCSPGVFNAFSSEVQRLQVASIRVRARAQAIQARGDAYFENWQESLALVKDPEIRERAERFRPQLQHTFSNVKLASQQTGEAFKPFFSDLRKLRRELEIDPAVIGTAATRALIRAAREDGNQVLQRLSAVQQELQAMTRILAPEKSSGNP